MQWFARIEKDSRIVNGDADDLGTTLCLLLLAITALAYWSVHSFPFVNYDDHIFVYKNPHVATGITIANLRWALTTLHGDASYWHPLTWISHQLDCQLFGYNAGAHHLTNLILHLINTILLFFWIHEISRDAWKSFLVAGFFALHPLHVETVAWISERKSLMCTVFSLLSLIAYTRYCRRPTVGRYLWVLLLLVCSLASKPMAVSLPILFLIIDFWIGSCSHGSEVISDNPINGKPRLPKNRGITTLLLEKIPFLVLVTVVSGLTMLAQNDLGAMSSLDRVPVISRLSNSLVAYVLYLQKVVWPFDLAAIYPLRFDWPWWQILASVIVLTGISAFTLQERSRRPYLLVGWLWYLVTLVPVIGIVQVGSQGLADRYTYLSLIGIFISCVWFAQELLMRFKDNEKWIRAACLGSMAALGLLARIQVSYWENSVKLWTHSSSVTGRNYLAEYNLGLAYMGRGNGVCHIWL